MSRYRKTMREALEEVYASDFNEGKMKDVYTMQQGGATAREIADKMKLPLKVVKDILGEDSINEKFTKKDFDRNEDENEHTKNSYELAKMFGDSSEKNRMTRLYNKTRKVGSYLTKAENDFVTMIQSKYYRRLREELELDEKYAIIGGEKYTVIGTGKLTPAQKRFQALLKKVDKDRQATKAAYLKLKKEEEEKVTTEEVELNEYSSQQIKQAYGILNDPRYKGGNYTGAVKAIEKLAKGLSRHPDVANALKRANEELDKDDTSIVKQVVAKLKKASKAHADQSKALDKAIKEEVQESVKFKYALVDTSKDNEVVAMSSDEKDLKMSVHHRNRGFLKIVKLKKPTTKDIMVGYPLKEETELTEYFATVHSKKPAIVKFINANKKNIDYVDIDAGSNIEFEGKGAHELADKVKAKFGVRVTKEEAEKVELNDIDENFSPAMIAQLKKAYGPLKGKRISPAQGEKLMGIMDKVDKNKNALIQLYKADIPFVSQLAVSRLIQKHNMKGVEINKLGRISKFREEVDLDESLFSIAVDKMIKKAKSLKKEPFIKKYMGTSIMPGSKILDRKSLSNIWDIHNAQMSSVHEEEELKEFNPNFGRDAQAGRGSTQTGERDKIVKDQKDKEAEIQSLKNDIAMLKTKLENEKNKAVKPEPNPETGEVPLTVGVAYKVFKDQEKKKIEKVKNIPNKFKLKEQYLGERAYTIKFDNVDGAIGHREADTVQAELKKMGFSARVDLTGRDKESLYFNTGVEKNQMKRLLSKLGYDLAEAVIAGKDYKYDGKGPVKISMKNYAKVPLDVKGMITGKPYMTVLNPKTKKTEMVPVKFTEELEESTASDQAKALGLTYYKFGRYGKGGKVTHKSTGGELRKFDAKTGKVGDVETKGKDDDAKSDSGDEKEVNRAGMTKSEMQKGLFKKDGSPSAAKLKGLITDKIRSQSGLGDSLGFIEYEYKGKDTLEMDADDSDELIKELEKNFGDALEIDQDENFVTARVKSKDELGDKDEPVDTSIPEPVRKMTKKINNSNFNNLNNMIAKFKRGSDEIDKQDAKDFEELIKLGQNVKLDGKKDKGKKEFIKKFKDIDEPAASDFVRALEKDVGEKAANYMLGTYDESYISEADLTDKQVKMVKKVAEKLPMKDFKKRYGKDAMNVKFGTATNIVKKKLNIDHNDKHAGARQVVESIKAVKNKAEKTGMPYSILKKVYDRGMAAWKGGHRPGATQVQWALARVNSFVTKSSGTWGKADKDLAAKVRAQKKD